MAGTSLMALKRSLRAQASAEHAAKSRRFFKTGKGEYAEGDRFIGITVPIIRMHVKEFQDLALSDVLKLLQSKNHEERLCAVLLMVRQFTRGDESRRREIYQAYLGNTQYINNWDLVDSSAYFIPGVYLFDKDRKPLYKLAKSSMLWERRIAIMSTFHFIRQLQFDDTLKLATLLLDDAEDLIHKAVGWMLREIGNRDKSVELAFLDQHSQAMPRTMLRYAIEKFTKRERDKYLRKV